MAKQNSLRKGKENVFNNISVVIWTEHDYI